MSVVHNEYLTKLKALMEEYGAHFDVTYNESGCECCGGDYEFEIHSSHGVTTIGSSMVFSYCVGHMIK